MDISRIAEWVSSHEALLAAAGAASGAIFLLSAFAVPVLINMIPPDYFMKEKRRESVNTVPGMLLFAVLFFLKNLAGVLFIISGFILLFMPGQGLLTMFIGVLLVDFPGKWELQKRIIRKKKVADALNWIRRKGGKKELEIPDQG